MSRISPLAFALLLPLAPLCAQAKHTLRYQFQPNASFWSEQTQAMNMVMVMGEHQVKNTMTTTTSIESKVGEVKDGTAAIDQTFRRVQAKSDGMGMKVDYDSDIEGSKPGMMKSLADLVGKGCNIKVEAGGRLAEMTLSDEMEDLLEKSGMSMKQTLEQSFMAWPKDPIAIGETWTTKFDMPMGQIGTGKVTVTNKLVDVKGTVVTLEQTLAVDLSAAKMPGGGTLEVTKATGTSKIDLTKPMPVESAMDMEMKMGGEGAKSSMTMTMRQTMKLVDAPAPKKPAEAPADKK